MLWGFWVSGVSCELFKVLRAGLGAVFNGVLLDGWTTALLLDNELGEEVTPVPTAPRVPPVPAPPTYVEGEAIEVPGPKLGVKAHPLVVRLALS